MKNRFRTTSAMLSASLLVACGAEKLEPGIPSLEVQQPARAAFLTPTADGQIRVVGRLKHVRDLVELRIDGEPVVVGADGTFAHAVAAELGINDLHVVATRSAGDLLEVRQAFLYGETGSAQEPLLQAHLGPEIFTYAGGFGADMLIERLEAGTLVEELTFSEDIPQCESITIHSITASGVDVGVTPQVGRLQLDGVLDTNPSSRLDVDFSASNCTFLNLDVSGNITAESADLVADILLTSDASVDVEVSNVDVVLHDYDVDLDSDLFGLLGEVLQWLSEDAVVEAIHDALVDDVAPMMQEQLNAMIGRHELATIDTPSGPAMAVANIVLADTSDGPAVRTTQAGLDLTARTEITLQAADPAVPIEALYDGPGPWWVPTGTPPAAADGQFVISLPQSTVNAVLYELWTVGLVDFDFEMGEMVQLLGEPLASMQAARVELEALLPPVVTARPGAPQTLVAQAGDVIVRLFDGDELQITLAVNAELTARLVRYESPELLVIGLAIDEVLFTSSALESPAGPEAVASLDRLLTSLAPGMIDSLIESKAAIRIPTPTPVHFETFQARIEDGLINFIATPAAPAEEGTPAP